jgi:hypothetical protein
MNSEISVLLKHFCTFVLVSSTISKIRGDQNHVLGDTDRFGNWESFETTFVRVRIKLRTLLCRSVEVGELPAMMFSRIGIKKNI